MTEHRLINRYEWKIEEIYPFDEFGGDADQICVDRLTGEEVVRYDLGDPANYAPSHGGWSKREYLENRGLDPDEEVEASKCVVPIPAGEPERHADSKRRRAERLREEAEAKDLHGFLPDINCSFDTGYCINDPRTCGKTWRDWENDIARPALEVAGYTSISFYMIEEDSFGPLIRGVVALGADGKRVRFFYG